MIDEGIYVLAGALIGFFLSVLIERWKNPVISISLEDLNPPIRDYTNQNKPANLAKFLNLKVWNKPVTPFQILVNQFLPLRAAVSVTGEIQFHHIDDGAKILAQPMRVRWSGHDETMLIVNAQGELNGQIIDYSRYGQGYYRVCYPFREETIDIAVKFDDDPECYGWTTESMQGDSNWKNPKYRLNQGRYLVNVTIRTEGTETWNVFRLENVSSKENFILAEATDDDIEKIAQFHPKSRWVSRRPRRKRTELQ